MSSGHFAQDRSIGPSRSMTRGPAHDLDADGVRMPVASMSMRV